MLRLREKLLEMIIQGASNQFIKDCSEIKDTKLNAHISLTFLAKSFINKSYLILISLEYVEHIHLIINIFQYH